MAESDGIPALCDRCLLRIVRAELPRGGAIAVSCAVAHNGCLPDEPLGATRAINNPPFAVTPGIEGGEATRRPQTETAPVLQPAPRAQTGAGTGNNSERLRGGPARGVDRTLP